jgi:hypothetical protein
MACARRLLLLDVIPPIPCLHVPTLGDWNIG